ncbi:hypothetical protein BCT62_12890 [Vibrio splendidus]|uniref:hypothetical protein n=1 Tax=Vibrio splendidus TaxID=29497 RepID=UPI000C8622C1|nr:hypothetical protein [Vibrio splendidus]PMM09452.1 hypothetical protein BCT62_12890 [Vibrio splendidus]
MAKALLIITDLGTKVVTIIKTKPMITLKNQKLKKQVQLTPAHQTFGKGGKSLIYRPFYIYNFDIRLFVLHFGTKACAI